MGAKPTLSQASEAHLIEAIVFMNLTGVGMIKEEVFKAAKTLAAVRLRGKMGFVPNTGRMGFKKELQGLALQSPCV